MKIFKKKLNWNMIKFNILFFINLFLYCGLSLFVSLIIGPILGKDNVAIIIGVGYLIYATNQLMKDYEEKL